MKNKRITSAIAALALVIVGSFAVPAMATDEDTGEQCVPSVAGTETIQHPAVTHTETSTVIDVPAWDDVVTDAPAGWQRYSWTGGPHASDDPPAFRGDWQANVKGDPHGIGVEGAYWRSNGNSGNGDWFYLEAVPATSHIVHHAASTHEEPVTITKEAWSDTIAYSAIVCPTTTSGTMTSSSTTTSGTMTTGSSGVVVAPAAVVVAPAAVVVAPAAVVVAAAPRFTG